MPSNQSIEVNKLTLDLSNYRTVTQKDEKHAVHAMIAVSPDRFWALLESLLDDGYHATENIIVENDGKNVFVVKEGNRRIAALKYALGLLKDIDIPSHLADKIKKLSNDWITTNSTVPCAIYSPTERDIVDKLVALTHAKGEKAARDAWTAVARARYDRDKKRISVPGLDILEAYLNKGKNRSPQQAERWAGDYPLTVLDEALQKIAPVLGFSSAQTMIASYPNKNKKILDSIMLDIGISQLGFKQIRDNSTFFGSKYGIVVASTATGSNNGSNCQQTPLPSGVPTGASAGSKTSKTIAVSSNDPRVIKRMLRGFKPKGHGREKVVTLRDEMKKLKISKHPHAFCFLLRSMFELSAKAYCNDHKTSGGPNAVDKNGRDKNLVDVLNEIVNHITQNKQDKQKLKLLHGSITELSKPAGLLSVTSMNQLVHNPNFSIQPNDICLLFGNVFSLLEEMNS